MANPTRGIYGTAVRRSHRDSGDKEVTPVAVTKVLVLPEQGAGRGWVVDVSGPTPPVATFKTQREAIARARQELANLGGGELEIRGRNVRIREARTLGAKENRRSKG
jgi:hypothetical protein